MSFILKTPTNAGTSDINMVKSSYTITALLNPYYTSNYCSVTVPLVIPDQIYQLDGTARIYSIDYLVTITDTFDTTCASNSPFVYNSLLNYYPTGTAQNLQSYITYLYDNTFKVQTSTAATGSYRYRLGVTYGGVTAIGEFKLLIVAFINTKPVSDMYYTFNRTAISQTFPAFTPSNLALAIIYTLETQTGVPYDPSVFTFYSSTRTI